MSGKKKKAAGKAESRAYGRLTRHERDSVQRMLERGASCRQIARELGRSPSTVSSEVASHRFVTAPKAWRGERVDASAGEPAAAARLEAIRDCLRRGAVARADGGAQRRPGGPVAVDHLPLGLGGLRRRDQHGAQAQGRLQAEEVRARDLGHAALAAVAATFSYLAEKRRLASIETLLRLSRLPRREPKTFEGFDFSRIQGRGASALGKLPSLADLYAHRSVAFVGVVSRKLV